VLRCPTDCCSSDIRAGSCVFSIPFHRHLPCCCLPYPAIGLCTHCSSIPVERLPHWLLRGSCVSSRPGNSVRTGCVDALHRLFRISFCLTALRTPRVRQRAARAWFALLPHAHTALPSPHTCHLRTPPTHAVLPRTWRAVLLQNVSLVWVVSCCVCVCPNFLFLNYHWAVNAVAGSFAGIISVCRSSRTGIYEPSSFFCRLAALLLLPCCRLGERFLRGSALPVRFGYGWRAFWRNGCNIQNAAVFPGRGSWTCSRVVATPRRRRTPVILPGRAAYPRRGGSPLHHPHTLLATTLPGRRTLAEGRGSALPPR